MSTRVRFKCPLTPRAAVSASLQLHTGSSRCENVLPVSRYAKSIVPVAAAVSGLLSVKLTVSLISVTVVP